jgi:hypothetical protein
MGATKATAEKSSTTASATRTPASSQAFFSPAGGGNFFPRIQARMTVNQPGDRFEKEADKTADKVMRMAGPGTEKLQRQAGDRIQRREEEKILRAPADEKLQKAGAAGSDEKLQRDAAGGGAPAPVAGNVQAAIHAGTAGGEALSGDVRGYMEPRFNADFGNVRVHRDGDSARLSNQLGARAFTYQNHIFFSRDQYQPDTSDGKHLLAHELTHTIQQGHAIQRSPQVSTGAATPSVQRFGVQDALDKFAEWAYAIPGFRLLTLIIGFNPINMRSADRTAANILRALIELIPGGSLITKALDNHGIINKAASWVEAKLVELGNIGGGLKKAIDDFLATLKWSDILHLDAVWERAKAIFTAPTTRLINFAISTGSELLKIVKEAILKPLAALAQGTRGYPLLCVILGEDPVTGEPVPRSAENLLGGFLKFIGQEEIWENIKKGNAIARAYAWFQKALAGLMGMVRAVPKKIVDTLKSLTFLDVVTIVGAYGKVARVFINIAADFISWGLSTIWDLLKIIIDVVKPGLMGYIMKTGAALKSILKDPMPFLGNLVRAAKLGFTNFADRIWTHLKAGLIDWLVGSLEGVYLPKALSLVELGKFALSVLGITWAQVRGKIVTALGPTGEKIMQGLEKAAPFVVALVTGGVAALWEMIKEKLNDLKDTVTNGIISFVTDTIVKKAIPKLIGMFIPGAGFIPAVISIYDTIMVFVAKISKIIQVVTAFIDSIVTIAGGNIGAAAKRVESVLAGLLSLAISFLAGFLGLGKVSDKIKDVIQKVREKVDAAIGAAVNWIVAKAKSMFGRLFGGKDKPDERSQEQKKVDLDKGIAKGHAALEDKRLTTDEIRKKLSSIKKEHNITIFDLVTDNDSERSETEHIHGEIHSIPVIADSSKVTKQKVTAESAHEEVVKSMGSDAAKYLKGHGSGWIGGHAGRGFSIDTRNSVDNKGYAHGDHSDPSIKTPGTSPRPETNWGKKGKGSWIPDHQPPDALLSGGANISFRFYPHSLTSARTQGGHIRVYKMRMMQVRKQGESTWAKGVQSSWFWN